MWFILSLFTAISEATKDMFSKKGLEKTDAYTVAWGLRVFALPFLLPLLFFIPIPRLDSQFWSALIINSALLTVTTILYMKAIKISPLSVSVPMLTFTPLFLLITSPFILGEFPSVYGLIGVILIVLGAYLLNAQEKGKGLIEPLRALVKEKGAILMLIVAFIWSVTSNIDKVGVLHSSSVFWVISVNIFVGLVLSIMLLFMRRNFKLEVLPKIKNLLPVGFFSAIALLFQMTAIKMTLVAYVISIKRTSTIFSSLYGFFVFKEPFLKTRLAGILIMVLGVLFITLL